MWETSTDASTESKPSLLCLVTVPHIFYHIRVYITLLIRSRCTDTHACSCLYHLDRIPSTFGRYFRKAASTSPSPSSSSSSKSSSAASSPATAVVNGDGDDAMMSSDDESMSREGRKRSRSVDKHENDDDDEDDEAVFDSHSRKPGQFDLSSFHCPDTPSKSTITCFQDTITCSQYMLSMR